MEPNYDYDDDDEPYRHRQDQGRRPPDDDRPPRHHQQQPQPQPQHQQQHHHASNADLLDSAKYLAGAAKSAFSHDSGKVDTGRAAGAAAELIDAASHYARLEEKSFGKYVDQAENYLRQYQSSHSTGTGHATAPAPTSGGTVPHQSSSAGHAPPRKDDDDDDSGGGYGDYIKLAQGDSRFIYSDGEMIDAGGI